MVYTVACINFQRFVITWTWLLYFGQKQKLNDYRYKQRLARLVSEKYNPISEIPHGLVMSLVTFLCTANEQYHARNDHILCFTMVGIVSPLGINVEINIFLCI